MWTQSSGNGITASRSILVLNTRVYGHDDRDRFRDRKDVAIYGAYRTMVHDDQWGLFLWFPLMDTKTRENTVKDGDIV